MLTCTWSGMIRTGLRGIALIPCMVAVLAMSRPAYAQDGSSPQDEARARALMADSDSDAAAFNSPQGEARARALMAGSDSDALAFNAAMRRLTSDEFEQRKARRLELQRRGYAAILHDLLRRNGPGAFLAMVRTKAQLDIHLPQNTLVVRIPVLGPPPGDPRLQIFAPPSTPPMAFPLIEDRRFPENPWRK